MLDPPPESGSGSLCRGTKPESETNPSGFCTGAAAMFLLRPPHGMHPPEDFSCQSRSSPYPGTVQNRSDHVAVTVINIHRQPGSCRIGYEALQLIELPPSSSSAARVVPVIRLMEACIWEKWHWSCSASSFTCTLSPAQAGTPLPAADVPS